MMAQLRAGVLPLCIETGRYKQIEVSNRLCVFCDLNEIEDEYHFVCKCCLYVDIRNDIFTGTITKEVFFHLMSNEQKKICTYIKKAWLKRKSALLKQNL